MVLEKTLESPLECKEIKPVNPKGNPSWIFIGRTDAEAESPILWPPCGKSWLIVKYSDGNKERTHWERLWGCKDERQPKRGQQRTRWLDGFSDSMNMSLSKLQEIGKHRKASVLPPAGLQNVRLSDWTTRTTQVLDVLHKVSSPLHLWYTGELAPFQLESQDYLSTSLRPSWSLCTQGQWENQPSGWMWGLSGSFWKVGKCFLGTWPHGKICWRGCDCT